ncbi:methionine--tRNA ligase [Oribacterium sp. oral taxon 102]|uniref:methionine--tRNA ligase n=1 Tax=Oribacterium sp. oral taxon 102 TaxID=671214 RepID=UPI0015B94754|nr:methionine--tRNA ligase [Oribacterium sp. oral taxon 102]NWO22232.1 methionine--tRNA ligase [Oribacterium sp. oral taxon 102]
MEKKPYYITTAIAYASGKPHIGNTYEIVLADAIARFKRFEGYDVRFQTGTDEHGQKIEEKAAAAGVTPKEYVDRVAAEIRTIWDMMNTSYDRFIRTTDPDHEKQVQKIFRKMYDRGDIYKGAYEGWYCTPCESFWTDSQLADGRCPDCGRPVQKAQEEAYFFRMSKYADRLMRHIEEHPEFIQPVSRKNEMVNNFLKPGLQDLCVSRTSFKWGIPVDFDPKHVVYVWLDALSNYATGLGFDVDGNSDALFEKYWPADLHLIGKDIIRFHTLYWPIFLMSLGLPLPKQVFGHPWLLTAAGKSEEGVKMSKSRGNVIYADDLVRLFGVDAVRFFVIHEMPFENDGVISWELMAERYNSMLANILGNLVKRTISMSNKYFGGVVTNAGISEPVDAELRETVLAAVRTAAARMEELRVADALTAVFEIFRRANKYIDETEPWVLAREEERLPRLQTVLYQLTEAITIGASLLSSFMPETSEAILSELHASARKLSELDRFGLYPSGNKVSAEPETLFERKQLSEVLAAAEKLSEQQSIGSQTEAAGSRETSETEMPSGIGEDGDVLPDRNAVVLPAKPELGYEDFEKLQFRVGKILHAEEVKKSKKLLLFRVQVGTEIRQILSGIKSSYRPEELVGRRVMVLCNLKPRMIAGFESQGMILSAEDAEGRLSVMTPERAMPAGAEIC